MKIQIIVPDNVINIDGVVQSFDLGLFVPSNVWAIYWDTVSMTGSIEIIDQGTEVLTDFSPYQPIVDEYENNKTAVKSAKEISQDEVQIEYKSGEIVTKTVAETVALAIPYDIMTADEIIQDRNNLSNLVDMEAGNARQRFISLGSSITDEYKYAYDMAIAYRDSGYTGTPDLSVSSWADINGITYQAAADDIIATGDSFYNALNSIRDIRLRAKALIQSEADYKSIYNQAILDLQAIQPA